MAAQDVQPSACAEATQLSALKKPIIDASAPTRATVAIMAQLLFLITL
jgi:hypothetical protein